MIPPPGGLPKAGPLGGRIADNTFSEYSIDMTWGNPRQVVG